MTISTGAPQGVCLLVLFTLYMNECTNTSHTENQYIATFSDDTAITNSEVQVYKSTIQNCVQWCDKHDLILNTKKQGR